MKVTANAAMQTSESTRQESEAETLRNALLLDLRPDRVQSMSPEELIFVQQKLGYGAEYGFWDTPERWLPAGHRGAFKKRIDFKSRLRYVGVPATHIDNAILCLARYAVLLVLVPTGQGPANGRYLKQLTLWSCLYVATPLIIASSSKKIPKGGATSSDYFGLYTKADLNGIAQSDARSGVLDELKRISTLFDRGLWPSRPAYPLNTTGPEHIPQVKGEDPRPQTEDRPGKHQPLPDDYIADGGWRALWVAKNLGPTLLDICRQFIQVIKAYPLNSETRVRSANEQLRRDALRSTLAEHQWVDHKGTVIGALPFPIDAIGKGGRKADSGQWPPASPNQVVGLLQLLQMAHLWIVLLSVGSRIGEMLSIAPGSIVRSPDGKPFANGLTFKLVDKTGGAERDWPLPEIAVEAIHQQEQLCDLIHQLGYLGQDSAADSKHESVWVRVGSRTEFASEISPRLRQMSISLGLTDMPGGKNLTTHRFRKSVARLAALALSGAPKILMDLFGHKSIEMTLHYILTDPAIRAEIKQIVEEVAVMRATEAIVNAPQFGGPAAKKIMEIIQREKAQLGRDLGASDIRQLAEILTLNGQSWELVRPGVICTKLPGGRGPCTKNVGRPEPSRCRYDCSHRLEQEVLRNDVDWSIAEAIRLYELEKADQNEMMQEMWAGQILTHLRRFDDLHKKWATNEYVIEVLRGAERSS